jgi:hypothetical protein
MIQKKNEVDSELLSALHSGAFAWEFYERSNVEEWYRNENLTLQLAKSAMVEFCKPTAQGAQELLEVYNHLGDFANQLRPGTKLARVEDLFELDVEIPHRVTRDELLVIASTSTSKKEIDSILKQHTSCFSSEYCNQCKVQLEINLGWNLDDLLQEFAKNPNLDNKQQQIVLDLADGNQLISEEFINNPSVSKDTKTRITLWEFWHDMDEDEVIQVIEAMKANPRFTASDVEGCRAYFEEEWGYGQDSTDD